MNTAGFSGAAGRQSLLSSSSLTQKRKTWLLRDIVHVIGSINLFLAKVHGFNYAFFICLSYESLSKHSVFYFWKCHYK